MIDLGPGLKLKDEDMLQRFAILAMSGAGKSNTAVLMAEQMYDAGIPWVAVDPKGDWYGVRSNQSGKQGGLPIPVFGGLHGDVPLEPTAGSLLAETIAEERLTCVLDVSEFTKGEMLRFLTDFALTLLKKNRDPLMVFAEEADDYLPQQVRSNEAQCVGAWSRMVKRGRFRGIFTTLITQRSASLNKDALTQTDTLIPMRVGSPQDRKAIEGWVTVHAHTEEAKELLESLPSLDDGEAWISSPNKLKLMKRAKLDRRRTFDSGDTPSLRGGRRVAKMADVDLDAISQRMTDTIEKAKAEDPVELRKQIAELQTTVSKLETRQPEVKTIEVEVEKYVFPEDLRQEILDMLNDIGGQAENAVETIGNLIEHTKADFDRRDIVPEPPVSRGAAPPRPVEATPAASAGPPPARSDPPVDGEVTGAALKMLQTLVQRSPMKLSRPQLATLSGYSIKSSTIPNSLTKLRNADAIVEENKLFTPSPRGFEIVGTPPPAPSKEQLIGTWRSALPGGAVEKFFDVLVSYFPRGITRAELCDITGVSPTSSTVPNTLTILRRNGLIEEDKQAGEIMASRFLFA